MLRCLLSMAIFVFVITKTHAQNLTGIWESNEGKEYAKIVMVHIGDSVFGYTYDRDGMGYCTNNFSGKYNKQTKEFKGKDLSVIARSFGHTPSRYRLNYKNYGDKEMLSGNAFAKGALMTLASFGLPIPVRYKKIKDQPDTLTAFMSQHIQWNETSASRPNQAFVPDEETPSVTWVLDDSAEVPEKLELKKRKDVLVQTIETSDTIKLALYDNGQIDGDTITLFHNDSIMLFRHCLTANAKILALVVTEKAPMQSITMLANNLGSIPPNTALLIIETKGKRYEVSLSSDFSTNAMVKFVYKKQQ
jgi:hypothetical protein